MPRPATIPAGRRKGRAGDHGAGQAGGIHPRCIGCFQQDLQEIRRAGIGASDRRGSPPEGRRIAGGRPESPPRPAGCARLTEDEAARRQVIGALSPVLL